MVVPVHLPLGSLLDAHSRRGAVDGVQAAERPPVGSRWPVVLEELNRGGVPMLTAAPELGGPAGLLCLSHSLHPLVRHPRGPPLVLPAHAHPSEPAAPGGPTRLSRASPAGSLLAQASPPGIHTGLPAARCSQSDRDRDAPHAGTRRTPPTVCSFQAGPSAGV